VRSAIRILSFSTNAGSGDSLAQVRLGGRPVINSKIALSKLIISATIDELVRQHRMKTRQTHISSKTGSARKRLRWEVVDLLRNRRHIFQSGERGVWDNVSGTRMPIQSESRPFAPWRSFLGDIRDKMHTWLSLGQIVLERPDPTLLDVRSIPGVALETAVPAPAPSPYLREPSRTSLWQSELGVIIRHR